MSYLPSKKFILTLVAILIASGVLWIAAASTKSVAPKPSPAKASLERIAEKTPPTLPAGLPVNLPPTQIQEFNATSELVLTYLEALRGGRKLTGEEQQTLAQQVAEETLKENLQKKNPYSAGDIKVDTAKSPKDYLNALAALTNKYFPEDPKDPNYESEVTVLKKIMDNKEDISLINERLEKFELRYQGIAADLKKLSTPPETADLHLAFLNSFSNTALALSEISRFEHDPVTGLMGMINYADETSQSRAHLGDLKKIIESHDVVFDKSDPGYQFVTLLKI